MKPTIGRVVIFHFPDSEKHINNQGLDAPAIITRVWSETCVNLKVLNDGIENTWKTSVPQGDGAYQWSWPTIVAPAPEPQPA